MANDNKLGKLFLVGLGPGEAEYLTGAAMSALEESDVVVGFRAYIEQAGDLLAGKELVSMELGQEIERASKAVELAYAGRVVSVVSSGDAGIYGMSGPVFQVLNGLDWDGLNPQVETVPGISAMQAAAALLGAPLMQDFCAISLSDLLTPWTAISQRLKAAARWTVYGGSCMAYAQIASGRIDVGIDVTFDVFDYLALVPIIEGAGGVITDWQGAPLTLASGDRFIAAGDARIHGAALQILAG